MKNDFFTEKNCCRTMYDESEDSNVGCIAIIKPGALCEDHKTADHQLFYLEGGFGCNPITSVNACYGKFCKDGICSKTIRLEKYDFLGIADEETEKYALKLMDPFTPKEREVLIQALKEICDVLDECNKYFKDEGFSFLKDSYFTPYVKLSSDVIDFPYIQYFNMTSAFISSSFVNKKKREIKAGLNPKEDPECIFLEALYKKLEKLMEATHE